MTRIYGVAGSLLSSLGVALLVCSVILAPGRTAFAQGTGGDPVGTGEDCSGCKACMTDNSCINQPTAPTCTALCNRCQNGECMFG